MPGSRKEVKAGTPQTASKGQGAMQGSALLELHPVTEFQPGDKVVC